MGENKMKETEVNTDWSLETRPVDVKYFMRNIEYLPEPYTSADSSRMSMLYFAIIALASMDQLEAITDDIRIACIEWVYSQQIVDERLGMSGFRGGPYMGNKYTIDESSASCCCLDYSHVTMTHMALSILIMLNDDLKKVRKDSIINSISSLQQKSGAFSPYYGSNEEDVRFTYSACAISEIFNNWGTIDKDAIAASILKTWTYDGGFANVINQEAHAGLIFCSVASLHLVEKIDMIPNKQILVEWLLLRQNEGFNGRINKPSDTCYAFWVGSSLKLLDSFIYINQEDMIEFLKMTHTKYGGFGKTPGDFPDLMHASLGFVALANNDDDPNFASINPALGITVKATKYLRSI